MEPKSASKFLKRKESVFASKLQGGEGNSLGKLKEILNLSPMQRTPEQIKVLLPYAAQLQLYPETGGEVPTEVRYQCCQHLSYEFVPCGKYVFHEGDEGSKFYIILSGSCSVVSADPQTYDLRQLSILRPGECFGELSLLAKMPRAAGIFCREDTHLAVLHISDYNRILSKIQEQQLQSKVQLIQRHPIFARWTKNAVQRLSYHFKLRQYRRKYVLFEENSQAKEIFLVKNGDFQLSREAEMKGKRKIDIALVTGGEILGAKEAIQGDLFPYSCSCNSAVGEVLVISKADFLLTVANEETIGNLLALDQEKEKHRSARLAAVVKLRPLPQQRHKQTVSESYTLDKSLSMSLRSDLVRGKTAIYSARTGLTEGKTHPQPLRLDNFSTRNLRSPKPVHMPKSKSWSEIVLQKYSIKPRKPISTHLIDPFQPQKTPKIHHSHDNSIDSLQKIASLIGTKILF